MVGIVVVSHSAQVAEGAVALARQMAGDVRLEAAGGSTETADGIGTDAMRVMEAIDRAGADGADVLILMDLGSAILSAETALQFLDPAVAERVRLCSAPVIEGTVAAAVTAAGGASLDAVAAEAQRGLEPKRAQLDDVPETASDTTSASPDDDPGDWSSIDVDVTIPNGLHARPAARFVQLATGFDATIRVVNTTTGAGPADASSLTDIATLGARQGHTVRVEAHGTDADAALAAIRALADRDFDEHPEPESAPSGPAVGTPVTMPPVATATAPGMPDIPGMPAAFQIGPDGSFLGMAAAPGQAVARARRLRRPPARPRVPGDPAEESAALDAALVRARSELRFARDTVARQAGEEHAAMLDAQGAMLDDAAIISPAKAAIAGGTQAEMAWQQSVESVAAKFSALDDPYLRARAEDVRDIGRRVLTCFAGAAGGPPTLRGPGILVARELGAGETASLDLSLVKGIAVATGSPTSHSAILARALGVPAVVNLGEGLMSIGEDTPILLDGDAGSLRIAPDAETVARVNAANAERERAAEEARLAARAPAETKDGVVIEVAANIATDRDAQGLVDLGADGVGLFRSEFLYMGRDTPPDEEEQLAAYTAAAAALDGGRLVIRTLDAGADKEVPGISQTGEENPFLGKRGIRLSLANPELFRTQLRAILRASAEHRIAVMFPMVATVDELLSAREQLVTARDEASAAGHAVGEPEVGVMIEVPSAALCAEALAEHVDFFSVGTNDLTQYTLAAERGNAAVADLTDAYHPAVLRLIGIVGTAAARNDVWVGVCGEAASDEDGVAVLLGLGVQELSVPGPRVAVIKERVRSLEMDACRVFASEVIRLGTAEEVRRSLTAKGCGGEGACCGGADHSH